MYADLYGTDWDTLDTEAAIERAYALGVLAELGQGLPEEYDRVRAAIDADPGADMVELAYDEGRQAVADINAGDRSDRETWTELVDPADADTPAVGDSETEDPPSSAPTSSISALEPPDDEPGMMKLPDFLRHD